MHPDTIDTLGNNWNNKKSGENNQIGIQILVAHITKKSVRNIINWIAQIIMLETTVNFCIGNYTNEYYILIESSITL